MKADDDVGDCGDSDYEGDRWWWFIADEHKNVLIENLQEHLQNVTIKTEVKDDLTNFSKLSWCDYADNDNEEGNGRNYFLSMNQRKLSLNILKSGLLPILP